MSNDKFDAQILGEKLTKLNNSQQSIESLSRWCITHRKNAKPIVETWDKLFNSSQKERRVSFLYVANDILQNSRRKGSEFVNEFWKVLPAALKHVYDNGDDHGKKTVTRLVDIWEQRKVFGSRGQNLKDELLGKNPPPVSVSNGKSPNPIKIVKRDANSVRIKLAVGGLPEKILTAFQSVLDEDPNEDVALNKCNAAAEQVSKIADEVANTSVQGHQHGSALVDQLHDQENDLQQCIGLLESAEKTRVAFVSQLREVLQDQESKLELIRTQLQVCQGQIGRAIDIRKMLTSPVVPGLQTTGTTLIMDVSNVVEPTISSIQPTSTPPQQPLNQPVISFAPLKTSTEEENKRAAAAAVAAKLTASTSSAQMLTSVLSSLVAEEAASRNGNLNSSGISSGLSIFPPEKRPKLEKPMGVNDVSNSDMGNPSYFTPLQQPVNSMSVAPSTSVQASFASAPPPPPLPPQSAGNPPASQYLQSGSMMGGVMPYGYGASTLPPPPPLPPHVVMGLARPASQSPQHPQQSQQQQQQPASGGYYRPPGIGFYGQSQPSTPPLPRQ